MVAPGTRIVRRPIIGKKRADQQRILTNSEGSSMSVTSRSESIVCRSGVRSSSKRTAPGGLRPPGACRSLDHLGHDAGADRLAALADGEAAPGLQGDRLVQADVQAACGRPA